MHPSIIVPSYGPVGAKLPLILKVNGLSLDLNYFN
jgi:hypothetical protein